MDTQPNKLFTDLRPITTSIAFIEADINSIADEFIRWQTPLVAEHNNSLQKKPIVDDLTHALLSLCPLTSIEARRYLLIPTQSNWVAFFDNGHTGTDQAAPLMLSMNLKARSIYVTHSDAGEIVFNYYDKVGEDIDIIRSISLIKERGWEFEQFGNPLSFEETNSYKSWRVKNRFNLELLVRYLEHFGIRLFIEEFYISKQAILINKAGPKFPASKELGLKEAQLYFRR